MRKEEKDSESENGQKRKKRDRGGLLTHPNTLFLSLLHTQRDILTHVYVKQYSLTMSLSFTDTNTHTQTYNETQIHSNTDTQINIHIQKH